MYQIPPFFSRACLWHNEGKAALRKIEKGRYIMTRKKGITALVLTAFVLVLALAQLASARAECARAEGGAAAVMALDGDVAASAAPNLMLAQDGADR